MIELDSDSAFHMKMSANGDSNRDDDDDIVQGFFTKSMYNYRSQTISQAFSVPKVQCNVCEIVDTF